MQGRPPKPTEQKRREGNPGKRPLPDTVLVGGRGAPERPKGLHPDAKRVWDEAVRDLEASGILDRADAPALEGLARNMGNARMYGRYAIGAEKEMGKRTREVDRCSDDDELDTLIDRREKAEARFHRWARQEISAWAEARQYIDRLGLSPSARSRLGLSGAEGKGREDEFNDNVGDSPRARLRAVEGGQP